MIYNVLLNLITFADNLIAHIQKQQVDKKSDFIDIVFLIYIEQIFDLKARGLYSDQEGFNLDEIIVSGTGLWYGVYFENLYNLNNQ